MFFKIRIGRFFGWPTEGYPNPRIAQINKIPASVPKNRKGLHWYASAPSVGALKRVLKLKGSRQRRALRRLSAELVTWVPVE